MTDRRFAHISPGKSPLDGEVRHLMKVTPVDWPQLKLISKATTPLFWCDLPGGPEFFPSLEPGAGEIVELRSIA